MGGENLEIIAEWERAKGSAVVSLPAIADHEDFFLCPCEYTPMYTCFYTPRSPTVPSCGVHFASQTALEFVLDEITTHNERDTQAVARGLETAGALSYLTRSLS